MKSCFIDNAFCHIANDLQLSTNIHIYYLLSNTTSHLQHMDTGAIRVFKAHYKWLYL